MKALITGVAGFIGSHLARTLLAEEGNSVLGIDAFTDYYDVSQKEANVVAIPRENFRLIRGDLLDLQLEPLLEQVDVVFHLAGQPGVRRSWGNDFELYTRNNITVTQKLLEAAKAVGSLDAFVYSSSSSVYGDAERYPTSESDRPSPLSPYGVTKLAGEHLSSLYASNFGVPVISLRYFTVYGPGQRPDMAFNKFITATLTGQPSEIYGDGEQMREFTHVSDIVRANILAARASCAPGTVINLSGGSSVSVNNVFDILAVIHGSRPTVSFGPKIAGDVLRTGGDTTRAREILGWQPTIEIDEGLRSEYEWLRERIRSRASLRGKESESAISSAVRGS
jgi:UDP-glucuronate 4-epimerase